MQETKYKYYKFDYGQFIDESKRKELDNFIIEKFGKEVFDGIDIIDTEIIEVDKAEVGETINIKGENILMNISSHKYLPIHDNELFTHIKSETRKKIKETNCNWIRCCYINNPNEILYGFITK